MKKIYNIIMLSLIIGSLNSMDISKKSISLPIEIKAEILYKLGTLNLANLIKEIHNLSLINKEIYNLIKTEHFIQSLTNFYLQSNAPEKIYQDVTSMIDALDQTECKRIFSQSICTKHHIVFDSKKICCIFEMLKFFNNDLINCLLENDNFLKIIANQCFKDMSADLIQYYFWSSVRWNCSYVLKSMILINCINDINCTDCKGRNGLIVGSLNGHEKIVKLLLKHNANPCIPDRDGNIALLWAASYGHEKVVKLLLDYNNGLYIKETDIKAALSLASTNGHLEIVKLLTKRDDIKRLSGNNFCNFI